MLSTGRNFENNNDNNNDNNNRNNNNNNNDYYNTGYNTQSVPAPAVPQQTLKLFLSEKEGIIAFPSSRLISSMEDSNLLSRKLLISTSEPSDNHEFDLLYNLNLDWGVSYTLVVEKKQNLCCKPSNSNFISPF